jgi:hypothetical protein
MKRYFIWLTLFTLILSFNFQAAETKSKKSTKAKKELSHRIQMVDGSIITGKLEIKEVVIKTRFGELKVPASDVISIYPGLRHQAAFKKSITDLLKQLGGKDVKKQAVVFSELKDKKSKIYNIVKNEIKEFEKKPKLNATIIKSAYKLLEEFEPDLENIEEDKKQFYGYIDQDRMITKKFEIVGEINLKSFNFKSKYGDLVINFSDLRRVALKGVGSIDTLHKSVTVSATNTHTNYKYVGFKVNTGDKIKFTATGTMLSTNYGYSCQPDGNKSQFGTTMGVPGGMLVARIGSSNKLLKAGSNGSFTVKRSGKLFLAVCIDPRYTRYGFNGSYAVKIKVERSETE